MASCSLRARHALSSTLAPLKGTRRPHARPSQLPPHLQRRHASSQTGTDSLLLSRLKTILYTTALGTTLYATYLYTTDTRASLHRYLLPPLLRLLYPDAERAHHAGTAALHTLYSLNLHPRERYPQTLPLALWTHHLANPIGISAGLDKDGLIPDALFALGASVVEIGGCTPRPQEGNPQPRVWRVPAVEGMVNRYGLNSLGADAMALKLRERVRRYARRNGWTEEEVLDGEAGVPAGSLARGRLLAVQVAKNKGTADQDVEAVAGDYVACVKKLGRYADVLVVNVSSPNTPGLRDLQAVEPLTRILTAVVEEAGRAGRRRRPRVMVKVSPDEDEEGQIEGICKAVWSSGVDGVIVGNTTKRRTGLVPQGVRLTGREQRALMETGGFSGPAMFDQTLDLVARYRKMLDGQSFRAEDDGNGSVTAIPAMPAIDGILSGAKDSLGKDQEQKVIFATGGITNGEQALKILNAGASVAMVYTGLVYGGAGTITRIKGEMLNSVRSKA